MKIEIYMLSGNDPVKTAVPVPLVVDLNEANEVEAGDWELFELSIGCQSYLVHIDDLCALGHAAQLRHEMVKRRVQRRQKGASS